MSNNFGNKRHERDESAGRESRAVEDREVTENREVTDADRLTMFRTGLFKSHLPDLPPIKGYHVCWLTTTNPRDSIQQRLMLGYELVTPEMVPQFQFPSIKSGEYIGTVGVNEMIAARLPMHLYEKYMAIAHDEAPREDEEKLADPRRFAEEARAATGKSTEVFIDSGFEEMRQHRPTPKNWGNA